MGGVDPWLPLETPLIVRSAFVSHSIKKLHTYSWSHAVAVATRSRWRRVTGWGLREWAEWAEPGSVTDSCWLRCVAGCWTSESWCRRV